MLLNGSFGARPTWSGNTVAPIYPFAGIGAMATWRRGNWTNRTGVFQADPDNRDSAFHDGALVMNELAFSTDKAGTWKLGVWDYRPHAPASSGLPPATHGGWISAEHALGGARKNAATAFIRAGWSPKGVSEVPRGLQAGVLVPAPLAVRPDDQLSLGVTRANLRGLGDETAWEATWLFSFGERVSLQPDIQYVVDPGGNLDSATVGILRLHVELD